MSDPIARDQEIAALREENSRLKAQNTRLRAENEQQGPVRITRLVPETSAVMPSDAQMGELLTVVQKHWPKDFADVAPDEFARAFEVLATFHRTNEPDTTVYAWHWTSAANTRLRNQGEVSLNAFLCAALAWSDIQLTDWRLASEGFLLEFGLNEYSGRLPVDQWQRTLRGEFVKPIDKRPKQRVGDGRTPRPSILIDGKELPNETRYVGPRYQDF